MRTVRVCRMAPSGCGHATLRGNERAYEDARHLPCLRSAGLLVKEWRGVAVWASWAKKAKLPLPAGRLPWCFFTSNSTRASVGARRRAFWICLATGADTPRARQGPTAGRTHRALCPASAAASPDRAGQRFQPARGDHGEPRQQRGEEAKDHDCPEDPAHADHFHQGQGDRTARRQHEQRRQGELEPRSSEPGDHEGRVISQWLSGEGFGFAPKWARTLRTSVLIAQPVVLRGVDERPPVVAR